MDNQEKYLVTKTNPIRNQRAVLIPCASFAVVGLIFGFAGAWGGALFIIGISALCGAFAFWAASRNVWKIVFRNSTVTVTCRSEYYHMDDLKSGKSGAGKKESSRGLPAGTACRDRTECAA